MALVALLRLAGLPTALALGVALTAEEADEAFLATTFLTAGFLDTAFLGDTFVDFALFLGAACLAALPLRVR